jgi:hypothetical protein
MSQAIGIGHQEDKKVLPGNRKIITQLWVTIWVQYDRFTMTLDKIPDKNQVHSNINF